MNIPPVPNQSASLSGPVVSLQTLDALLHIGVQARSNKAAVIHATGELSFLQLHAQADAIACSLQQNGVSSGDRVGVLLRRDKWLVPSLLAILKMGASYVPLDASYPAERLRNTLNHANVACLLATPELALNLAEIQPQLDPAVAVTAQVSGDLRAAVTDELPANLIYTSGTTGQPKGVSVSRAAIANLLVAVQDVPALVSDDRVLGLSTIAFDIHVLELLAPLSVGATIVLADDSQITQPAQLLELIETNKVTLIQATPSLWGVLLRAGLPNLPNTRGVAGGERLAPATAIELERRLQRCWNMYGPTEATVYTTAKRLEAGSKVTIGTPLANISVAIVQQQSRPITLAAIGEVGELAIMGAGLATGYWQNPVATAQHFIDLSMNNLPVRTYLTGDLGFIDRDGNVHCQGRVDQQIKLRGHRLELSEIEHALMAHPQLVEAACSVHSYAQDDDRLVAYHTNNSLPESELREFVAQTLPQYMVPQHFLCVPQLPRLASGKLDRSSLPRPQWPSSESVRDNNPSAGSTDRRLLEASWRSLLGGAPPENDHNFMDQGGHSLLALRLVQTVSERTGKALPVRLVVLEDFAALVAHLESQKATRLAHKGGILSALKKRFSRNSART